jgi:hypothetical protein
LQKDEADCIKARLSPGAERRRILGGVSAKRKLFQLLAEIASALIASSRI